MNEMSEYYDSIRKMPVKKKRPRIKRDASQINTTKYSLVYVIGERVTEIIVKDVDYAICVSQKKLKISSGQYKQGRFEIIK